MNRLISFLCLTTLILGSKMHAMDSQDRLGKKLIDAAARGKLGLVKRFLAQGAAVDVKDKHGETPLTWAVINCHVDVCKLLIDVMVQSIQESRARAIALLGMKKHRAPIDLNIIDRHIVELIAQQVHAPAIQQQRNLFAQINRRKLHLGLLEYARHQLEGPLQINAENSHARKKLKAAQNSNQGNADE